MVEMRNMHRARRSTNDLLLDWNFRWLASAAVQQSTRIWSKISPIYVCAAGMMVMVMAKYSRSID